MTTPQVPGRPAAILAVIEAEVLTRRGWDQPPSLYFLSVRRHGPVLRRATLPPGIWRTAKRPADVLDALADAAGAGHGLLRAIVPPDLYGVGFMSEAWEVITEPDATEETRARNRADSLDHRLHTRPDRIEIRAFVAVDRAGLTYSSAVRRDTGRVSSEVLPREPDHTALGSIPESLDAIVWALLGVELPARPDERLLP